MNGGPAVDLQHKRTKLLETISRLAAVVEHTHRLDNFSKRRSNQVKVTLAALRRPVRAEAVPKDEIANILQKCKERVTRSAELLESSRELSRKLDYLQKRHAELQTTFAAKTEATPAKRGRR